MTLQQLETELVTTLKAITGLQKQAETLKQEIKVAKRAGMHLYSVLISYKFVDTGVFYCNVHLIWAYDVPQAIDKVQKAEDYYVYKGQPSIASEHGPYSISDWSVKIKLFSDLESNCID